jgi:hypothetical protein
MYNYSKLYPKYKSTIDEVSDLVDYINDVKPYHTKIDDIIIQYTFVENIITSIAENHQKVIDFIIDYNIDESGYDVKRYDHAGYDGELISVTEYYPTGFNKHGFDSEHFDALPTMDYVANTSPTTIKSSIKEHLVIDISRYELTGYDYVNFDDDLFDTLNTSKLPETKSYIHPVYFGDIEFEHFTDGWLDFDTHFFDTLLTIVSPEDIEPYPIPKYAVDLPFDDSDFDRVLTIVLPK